MAKYYMYRDGRKIIRTDFEILKEVREDCEWDALHSNLEFTEDDIRARYTYILSEYWIPISPLLVNRVNGDRARLSNLVALAHENLSRVRRILG